MIRERKQGSREKRQGDSSEFIRCEGEKEMGEAEVEVQGGAMASCQEVSTGIGKRGNGEETQWMISHMWGEGARENVSLHSISREQGPFSDICLNHIRCSHAS